MVDGGLTIPNADAWGLRIVDSTNILIYGAGLYSFFNNYSTACSNQGAGEVSTLPKLLPLLDYLLILSLFRFVRTEYSK